VRQIIVGRESYENAMNNKSHEAVIEFGFCHISRIIKVSDNTYTDFDISGFKADQYFIQKRTNYS
jgi:hypothetical protein